jgi:N-acetylhexosamine 1-kinase
MKCIFQRIIGKYHTPLFPKIKRRGLPEFQSFFMPYRCYTVASMIENTDMLISFERVRDIASQFDLSGSIEVSDFPEKGNINQQTYLVQAGPPHDRAEYILQMLNPDVFTQPHVVMDSMISCIQAQQKAMSEGILGRSEEWETIRLIPSREGRAYLDVADENGSRCWRMMSRIRQAHTYRSLRGFPDPGTRLHVAEEAGRGLAIFGILTAEMDVSIVECPLPGYRHTGLYYDQLLSILKGNRTLQDATEYLPADPIVRQSTEKHFLVHNSPEEYGRRLEDPELSPFITLALEEKSFALTLLRGLENGILKKTVIHGDTKLDNFLFSTVTGKVKALVDLDTIMPHTWLSDWGDMVRSLVNIAGERDAGKIDVDIETYKALARGFLGSARHIPMQETALMTEAPQIMALELGVRFLADYLRGDTYFHLGPADPPDLNRIRAMVQFRLFENLRRNAELLRRWIEEVRQ